MWICLWEKLKIHIKHPLAVPTLMVLWNWAKSLVSEVRVMVNQAQAAAYKPILCPCRMWEKSALKPVF